jgi:hypothetical protein
MPRVAGAAQPRAQREFPSGTGGRGEPGGLVRRSMLRPLLLSVPLVLLGTACGDPGGDQSPFGSTPPQSQWPPCLDFNETGTLFCSYSALTTRERRIIQDSTTWATVWTEAWSPHSTTPALPEVDFSLEMVVLAAMGEQSTGGYAIDVQDVTQTQDVLNVTVVERTPGLNCAVTLAFTQPFAARRVSRFDGPVHFVEQEIISDCSP